MSLPEDLSEFFFFRKRCQFGSENSSCVSYSSYQCEVALVINVWILSLCIVHY